MQYRPLGRTGWNISTVSFGAWAIGGTWGEVDDKDSMAALHRALDDRRFALDHLEVKLFGLVDTMNTATGRAIASAAGSRPASARVVPRQMRARGQVQLSI